MHDKRTYLVWVGEYSDRDVVAVFDDKTELDEWLEQNPLYDAWVQTRITNPPIDGKEYKARTVTRAKYRSPRGVEWKSYPAKFAKIAGDWGEVQTWGTRYNIRIWAVDVWGSVDDTNEEIDAYGKELIEKFIAQA